MKVGLTLVSVIGATFVLSLGQAENPSPPSSNPIWDTYRHRFEATQRELSVFGAGGCTSSNCHGGAEPRTGEVFTGHEWNDWWGEGKGVHFGAHKALFKDRSIRMAQILYGADAAAKDQPQCLECHALSVPEKLQERAFDINEGVTCESCHGRAGRWRGEHDKRAWKTEISPDQKLKMGYYSMRPLIQRAERCLECHLGTDTKQVTHDMMAAGHPALTFELTADLENVPRHWKDEQSHLPNVNEGAWFHARVWAVGQAVALRESAYRLAHWASGPTKIDFALMECYSCHHDLTDTRWRQNRTFMGKLGEPTVELSSWAVCRSLVEKFMPDQRSEFEQAIESIIRSISIVSPDRESARSAAAKLAALADQLSQRVAQTHIDKANTLDLLKRITGDGEYIAGLGYRAANQAYQAVDVLYGRALLVSGEQPPNHDAIRQTIVEMNQFMFENNARERTDGYDGEKFKTLLQKLHRLLNDGSAAG